MSFSDEDLKRLKEISLERSIYPISNETLKALLARLEAAEKAFEAANEFIANDGAIPQDKIYIAAYDTWLHSAGKSR